jgi:hypothetical protein
MNSKGFKEHFNRFKAINFIIMLEIIILINDLSYICQQKSLVLFTLITKLLIFLQFLPKGFKFGFIELRRTFFTVDFDLVDVDCSAKGTLFLYI